MTHLVLNGPAMSAGTSPLPRSTESPPSPGTKAAFDLPLHAVRMAALVQVRRLLANSEATPETLMDRVPDLALSVVEASGAIFELLDGDALILRSGTAAVLASNAIGVRLPLHGSLSGEAIRLQQTLRCDEAESDPRVDAEACRKVGLRSMIATVVRDKAGPIGVLKLFDFAPARFGAAEADSLELLAEALGTAIQRKRAEEALQRSLRNQSGIVRLQQKIASSFTDLQGALNLIVESAQELTGAQGASIASLDGDSLVVLAACGMATGRLGARVRRWGSLAGHSLARDEVLCCEDSETDSRVDREVCRRMGVRSIIIAPVRTGEAGAGVAALRVMSSQVRAFAPADVSTLQIVAEWLGTVMQRFAAEHQLRSSESQYRQLFAAHPHPMWVFEVATLRFLAVNDSAIAQYGYSKEEFLAMTLRDIRTVEGNALLDAYLAGRSPAGKTIVHWQHRRKDGSFVDVESSDSTIVFEGRPARLVLAQDITDRTLSEEKLRSLAARLSSTLESISDGFYTLDRDWRFTYINAEAERLIRRLPGELIGRVIWEAIPRLLGTPFEAQYRDAVASNRAVALEVFYPPFDMWLDVHAYPSEAGLTVHFRDVSARHLAQQALHSLNETLEAKVAERTHELELSNVALASKEEEIRSVVEHMADGVITFSDDGIVRSANSEVEAIFGHPAADLVSRHVALLIPGLGDLASGHEDRTSADAEFVMARLGRETFGRHRNGDSIALDVGLSAYRIPGQRLWTAIVRDIGERVRIMADLEQARNGAEEASRAKSAFVAAMSHEIRTPMNGVIGMIDVLHQTDLAPEQARMLSVARESAHSLLAIIEDILDFSKIEAGRIELERLPFSLTSVVTKVCELIAGMAAGKAVALATEVDAGLPAAVWGDAGRLRQVLVNLLSNAIKFSTGRPGARVSVRATLGERVADRVDLRLEVEDNGIGMDEATVAGLFAPFVQADASMTRRFGGTGLGLAISHHLLKLMGGYIEVRSTPGLGSLFTVRLPFFVATTPAMAVEAGLPTPAQALVPPVGDPAGASLLAGRLVLVAEDNEINQQVISQQLRHLGLRAEIVANGVAALALWRTGRFDMLLTDLQMPEMDGYELAASIRAEEAGSGRMPIIALTANALKEEADHCKAVGMDGYLTKPVRMAALGEALQSWLVRREPVSEPPGRLASHAAV